MNNQSADWTNSIGRLIALAERCAAEGQLNLNKLTEAAVYAKIRRAGWQYRPSVTAETLSTELEAGLKTLAADEVSPDLVAAIEIGWRTLAERGSNDLLSHEAPDVFVCRTCGKVALGSPPQRCPDCGSWPGRFRKFISIFNGDNSDLTNPYDVLTLLGRNAETLSLLTQDLSEDEMTRPANTGGWSVRNHIAHFYDTQDLLETRVDLMLKHDNPELKAVAVFEFAAERDRHPAPTHEMLAQFRDKRTRFISRLESLPLKDLWRSGQHPEFGKITVLRQTAYMAYHEQTHFPDIEVLREQIANKV